MLGLPRRFRGDNCSSLLDARSRVLLLASVRKTSGDAKRAAFKLRETSWADLRNIFALAVPYRRRIFRAFLLIKSLTA